MSQIIESLRNASTFGTTQKLQMYSAVSNVALLRGDMQQDKFLPF